MRRLVVLIPLVALIGCANVTTMKINRTPDGALSINSGKDVSIGSLSYSSPSGETLDIEDYTSNASAAAIDAQAAREQQMIDGIIKALQAGAALKP